VNGRARLLRVTTVLVAVALLATTGACGKRTKYADQVRAFIRNTEAQQRAFIYDEKTESSHILVKGAVADDFRYKALVEVNGLDVLDEVVSDDAVADRVLDPAGLTMFARKQAATPAGAATVTVQGPSTTAVPPALDSLRARRWVVDHAGAPTLLPAANDKRLLGDDPIFDALTVFRYVDAAMDSALDVHKFNRDALDYKPQEDPFPQPAPGSGVVRYDLTRKSIPRQQEQLNGNQAVPVIEDFRKMSIYVRHGLVIQVLEDVDVASRLEDLGRNYAIKFTGATTQENVDLAIKAINAVTTGQGREPIRVRQLSFKLLDIGQPEEVRLPPDAVAGSLLLFENRGKLTRPAGPGTAGGAAANPSPAG